MNFRQVSKDHSTLVTHLFDTCQKFLQLSNYHLAVFVLQAETQSPGLLPECDNLCHHINLLRKRFSIPEPDDRRLCLFLQKPIHFFIRIVFPLVMCRRIEIIVYICRDQHFTIMFRHILLAVALLSTLTLHAQSPAKLRSEIVKDLKENILRFWIHHAVDPSGGFYGRLKRDGTPVADAPKGGVLNARILWTFSTAYRMYGDSVYKVMADRAQRYFTDHFVDEEYGGAYWLVRADGSLLDGTKQTYGCSYAVYGLAEHFRATGNLESLRHAVEIYRTMERIIRDPVQDGYIETFARNWQQPEKIGYDGDGVATKTMNTHIHVLEAYTALYRVWRNPGLRERLHRLTELMADKFYNPVTRHLNLYLDRNWNNLKDIDSYGHDIETSWLLTEAAELLDDDSLKTRCSKLSLALCDAALADGLNDKGGMMYERNGNKLRRDSQWWCQAETVLGCVNAWQLTGEARYLRAAERTWSYIKQYVIDTECGEWFKSISADGRPNLDEDKASMWYCPYHNARMGFEIDARLKEAKQ